MATNFSIADGVKVIAENQNQEQLEEFGKRFPRLAIMISKCVAKAGDDFVELMSYIPSHVTAQKVNKSIKDNAVSDGSDEEPIEEAEGEKAEPEKPASKKRGRKPKAKPEPEPEPEPVDDDEDDADDDGYQSKTAKELYNECKKRGLKVEPRKSKNVYIEALEADDAKGDDDDEDDDDWDI